MAFGGPESTPFLVFPGAHHFGVLMANLIYFVNVYVCCYLFVLLIIYFGCAGSSLLLELFHLHRAGVLLVAVCGLLTVGASRCGRRPQAQGLQWLRQAGSAVAAAGSAVLVVHGLSCSTACGISLDQGLNLCPLHWQVDSYPLRPQGSPYMCFFLNIRAHSKVWS